LMIWHIRMRLLSIVNTYRRFRGSLKQ
jgi:hypothetical protein